jgi:hypothetical protein
MCLPADEGGMSVRTEAEAREERAVGEVERWRGRTVIFLVQRPLSVCKAVGECAAGHRAFVFRGGGGRAQRQRFDGQ